MLTTKHQASQHPHLMSHSVQVFDICGGVAPFVTSLADQIVSHGFRLCHDSTIKVLLDIPQGSAFSIIRDFNLQQVRNREEVRLIIVTYNLCPEYCEDLWNMEPDVLLVNPKSYQDFVSAITRAADGERYRTASGEKTSLTCIQRRILQLVANGWHNRDIAEHLNVHEKTIMNTLTSIYRKLSLNCRQDVILYYWGISPCERLIGRTLPRGRQDCDIGGIPDLVPAD